MTEEKVLKNPEAPGGRKDWVGRSPRWRPSLRASDSAIIIEALEYLIFEKGLQSDERYTDVLMRLKEGAKTLQTPLTETIFHYTLFEESAEDLFEGDDG